MESWVSGSRSGVVAETPAKENGYRYFYTATVAHACSVPV